MGSDSGDPEQEPEEAETTTAIAAATAVTQAANLQEKAGDE